MQAQTTTENEAKDAGQRGFLLAAFKQGGAAETFKVGDHSYWPDDAPPETDPWTNDLSL